MELKLLGEAKQADHNVLQPKQFNFSPQEQRRKEAEDNNKTSMRLDMVTPKTKLIDKNGKVSLMLIDVDMENRGSM